MDTKQKAPDKVACQDSAALVGATVKVFTVFNINNDYTTY